MAAFRAAGANADLRLVQAARFASVTGRWAYTVTLAVFAYRDGGALGVAVASIVRLAPATAAAPFAGAFVRRLPTDALLFRGGVLRTLALAAAGAAVLGGWPAWAVYACVAVESATSTVLRPIQNSLLPALSRTPEELTSANLALSVIESAGLLLGPLAGAVLLQGSSVGTVFLASAGAYAASALLLLPVRAGEPADLPLRETDPAGSALARLRAVATNGDTSVVLFLYGAQNLVAGALNVLIVVTALRLLGLGQSSVGALTAAIGVGGVVGGGLVLSRFRRDRHGSDLALGLVLWGVPLVLLAVLSSELAAFVLLGVVGVGVTVVDVSAVTLLQRAAQGEVLADALGVLQAVFVGSVGVGTLLAPLLVSSLGIRGALLACGALLPLLAAGLWRRLRRLDGTAAASGRWSALLAEISIFAPLSEGARDRLGASLAERAVTAGTVVFSQGDAGDGFYVIAAGACDVEIAGSRVRTLATGESFGEIALLRDVPRTATVRAVADTQLLRLDRRPFLEVVTGNRASADAADAVVGARLGLGGSVAVP